MAVIRTLIGNIKGPKGDAGEQGPQGPAGSDGIAASVTVGTTTTSAAGSSARVENVGTESNAILNFTIPQGPPGSIGEIARLPVNEITTSDADFPVPAIGDTIATIAGKIIKAVNDIVSALNGKVSKTGDVMTGPLQIHDSSAAFSDIYIGNKSGKNGRLHVHRNSFGCTILPLDTLSGDCTCYIPNDSGVFALTKQLTNGSVTKVGTATVGGANTNMYLNAGVPTAGNTFIPSTGGVFSGTLQVANPNSISYCSLGAGVANYKGALRLYNGGTNYATLTTSTLTGNRTFNFPDAGGTVATTGSSSRRIKENIRDMSEDEAQRILDVEIVKFDYIGSFCGGEKNQSGVIAEDVIDVIPEAVRVFDGYDEDAPIDEETNPSPEVDYRKFVPYLIKMVQMQQKKIEELDAIIKERSL